MISCYSTRRCHNLRAIVLSRTYTLLITVHSNDPPSARELAGGMQTAMTDSLGFAKALIHGWEGDVTAAPPEIKNEHRQLLREVRQ